MNTGQEPSCSSTPTALFPAYASTGSSAGGSSKEDGKAWLCNSSFAPTDQEKVSVNFGGSHFESVSPQEVVNQVKAENEEIKHASKKKKHKHENPALIDIPESESIRAQLRKITFIEETGLSFERAYYIDQTCDRENFQFECFERKKIANYKLNSNVPLGLSASEHQRWPQPTKKKKKPMRYFNKKCLTKLKDTSNIEKIRSKSLSAFDDFIPINLTEKNQTLQQANNFDNISVSWKLSINPKSDPKELNLPIEDEFRSQVIEFNKSVSEHPHDIQKWLEFVDFQDILYKSSLKPENNTLNETALIEKKVAILDKALSLNPKAIELNVAKLDLCKDIWKMEELMSAWETLTFINPHDVRVWQHYLFFILTNMMHFNIQRVLKLYSKCLRTLSNLSEGILQSHEAPPDVSIRMLEIFGQLCYVLKSCGYAERAIATFQALVEFNLFAIPSLQEKSIEHQIKCFEPFWVTGAPRIGEDGAKGWASTMSEKKFSSDKIISELDLIHFEEDILDKNLPLSETWFEFEGLRETHYLLPWRPNLEFGQTDDDIDDAERVIGFVNVSKFLFRLSEEKEFYHLILHFLTFLGCNVHEFDCSLYNLKSHGAQINVESFDLLSLKISDVFSNKFYPNPLNLSTKKWTKERIKYVNNVFTQVMDKFSGETQVKLYLMWLKFYKHLALKLKNNSVEISADELKSFAKSLLEVKENRNCLLLWSEYIHIESIIDSKSKAKKTFMKLLKSMSAVIAEGSMNHHQIWPFLHCYIEFSLENSTQNEIVNLIAHFACKEKYTSTPKPPLILKATSLFKHFIHLEMSYIENGDFCACIDPYLYSSINCTLCFMYLYKFTQSYEAALNAHDEAVKLIEAKCEGNNKRYFMEKLCASKATFLNYHTWQSSSSIKPLQSHLYDAVTLYPTNVYLLYLLVKLKSASAIIGPTRRFFAKILKDQPCPPTTWIFALVSELAICYSLMSHLNSENEKVSDVIPSLGINWKIRSIYEDALQDKLSSHDFVIWRSYVHFEILCGDADKAKGIFYRALQSCVWSKELLMDGIKYFPDDFQQIMDYMVEKQIRVRTLPEEVMLLMENGFQDD